MKLDPTVMRTMSKQHFRVLTAVETGMRNHALVPSALITSIANLRHGGTSKILSALLRDKLLSHDRSCGYDGYRLTNSGYDILALYNLKSRGLVVALGDRIGTGKESDVYLAATSNGRQIVLKFHRLGRTSFRDVKKKRDYFMVNALSKNKKRGSVFKQQPNSWLFLSKISAMKEYAFMKALYDVGYPTPQPIGQNRHIVAMGLVRGVPLYQIPSNKVSANQAGSIFSQSVDLAKRLAQHGLVHCDLNEFNLMVDLSGIQTIIADDDHMEHYVRHSGMDVGTMGALSARGPIEKHKVFDGTGEVITEEPPKPMELLEETGEPKPVVTLIDFPQMVSVRHPNAKELFERDWNCLKRFFVGKLKCQPPDDWEELVPDFDDLVVGSVGNKGGGGASKMTSNHEIEEEEEEDKGGKKGACLASTAQLRLDEELRASGYSADDAGRDVELYYYERDAAHGIVETETTEEKRALEEVSKDEKDDDGSKDGDGLEECDDSEEGKDDEVEKVKGNDEKGVDNDSISDNDSKQDDELDQGMETKEQPTNMVDMSLLRQNKNNTTGTNNHNAATMSKHSIAGTVLTERSYAIAEEIAKERVRKHLDNRKQKGGRKNAFRSKNSNKTFVKGKRVMAEHMDF